MFDHINTLQEKAGVSRLRSIALLMILTLILAELSDAENLEMYLKWPMIPLPRFEYSLELKLFRVTPPVGLTQVCLNVRMIYLLDCFLAPSCK